MSLDVVKKRNPNRCILTVQNKRFEQYGKVLGIVKDTTLQKFEPYCKNLQNKCEYEPNLPICGQFLEKIKTSIYGGMNIQCGIVQGMNKQLTGIEYHQGSEVNIALSDCILLLGKKADMKDDSYDTALIETFYLRKNEVIEIYSDTLHYTPIQSDDNGFALAVILLEGTNTCMDVTLPGMLIKKNKWYITHSSQLHKIEQGCLPNLIGDLIEIK